MIFNHSQLPLTWNFRSTFFYSPWGVKVSNSVKHQNCVALYIVCVRYTLITWQSNVQYFILRILQYEAMQCSQVSRVNRAQDNEVENVTEFKADILEPNTFLIKWYWYAMCWICIWPDALAYDVLRCIYQWVYTRRSASSADHAIAMCIASAYSTSIC